MGLDSDSFRFFPQADVVEATGRRTLGATIKELDKRGQGAVLIKKGKRPVAMVRVERLLAHAKEVAGADAISRVKIEDIASKVIADPHVVWVPGVEVDVHHDPDTLRAREDAVFAVSQGGSSIGYYMNHETVRDILTRPPDVYICDRGHENSSYNDGWCGIGPHPIVDSR